MLLGRGRLLGIREEEFVLLARGCVDGGIAAFLRERSLRIRRLGIEEGTPREIRSDVPEHAFGIRQRIGKLPSAELHPRIGGGPVGDDPQARVNQSLVERLDLPERLGAGVVHGRRARGPDGIERNQRTGEREVGLLEAGKRRGGGKLRALGRRLRCDRGDQCLQSQHRCLGRLRDVCPGLTRLHG